MALANIKHMFKENFSKQAFMSGLGAVAAIYILMFIWVFLNSEQTLKAQQDKLASLTVLVEHRDIQLPKITSTQDTAPKKPIPGTGINSDKVKPRPPIDNFGPLQKLANGMVAIPVKGLSEKTPTGAVPQKRKDGLTVFDAYRRPFDRSHIEAPIISIAIVNLGLSSAATESAIKNMPADISLIMSPYAGSLEFWINEARENGHEVWISLPMETKTYPLYDPGPHTLLINGTSQENARKLNWVMERAEGYVGFVTQHEPTFMKSYNDMRPIVEDIYNKGLAFIDGSADPTIIPQSMALGLSAPYATIDVWLDVDPSKDHIQEKLAELEKIANERGMAAGVIHAYPISYNEIKNWITELQQKGFILAPLSAQTGM